MRRSVPLNAKKIHSPCSGATQEDGRMSRIKPFLAFVALIALVGCGDQAMEPEQTLTLPTPAFAKLDKKACPLVADVVVDNEADLLNILAAAGSGDVIGIDGIVPLTAALEILNEGVTLTCATAGSGFTAAGPYTYMVYVGASNVTLDRLIFDGTDAGSGAVYADFDGVVFTRNVVYAGPDIGAFFPGANNATVVDNQFLATIPTGTGLHIQGGIVGLVVTGNTAETLVPSKFFRFGGIRVHNAMGAVISDNVVIGPWLNGMSLTLLEESQIERNLVKGAVNFGMAFSFNTGGQGMRNNVIRNNRFTGTGSAESVPPWDLPPAGILANDACYNTFFGNNLNGNYNGVGAVFTESTGGNTMVGNQNVVFDDGNRDCDGDENVDPNHFSGSGKLLKGGFGRIISEAASGTGGMK
jgi:hypothetical protein